MTSQQKTGTHPFYIGMYIHIYTHIYVHIYIYTSQKECLHIFSRLINRAGLALPIETSFVELTCRRKKPKVESIQLNWPVLSMKSWIQFLGDKHPELLLGGHKWHQDWRGMFSNFWSMWREMEPHHEIFSTSKPLTHCVPILTHGDEGQTLRKTSFLVLSFQPVISWQGMKVTTMSGFLDLAVKRKC